MFAKRFRNIGDIERRRIVMPADVRMRLNRLEKPESWPADLLAQIMIGFRPETIQQYPDYKPFYEQLASFIRVPADRIVVGAGIEEHIRSLFMLCCEPGDKVAVLWPTCAMFEIYARVFGVELVKITPEPGRQMTASEFMAALPDRFALMILANPGQPVENCFSVDELRLIGERCRVSGAVFAVDEAYYGFGAPSALPLIHELYNLVVLRTFSKAFGAASIRLGYAAGSVRVIRALDALRQSGEVSAWSMHVASVLMKNFAGHVTGSILAICEARDKLRERIISQLGLQAWGRLANHVLIDLGDAERLAAVNAALAARGIYVKANFPAPLDRHMLVTCGSPRLMHRFFTNLKGVL